MIKFNNNIFSQIIPIGEECYTCQSIDKKFNKNFRSCGYPYDYVGHTFISKINDNIKEIQLINNNDIKNWYSGQEYFYLYEKYGFKYWHDTKYKNENEFLIEDKQNFIDKYNKRYSRLINILNNNDKVIFFTVCHFDDIYYERYKKDELLKLYNTLIESNKNIILIAINYDNNTFIQENLYHYCININKTDNFQNTKENFMMLLYDFVNKNFFNE